MSDIDKNRIAKYNKGRAAGEALRSNGVLDTGSTLMSLATFGLLPSAHDMEKPSDPDEAAGFDDGYHGK